MDKISEKNVNSDIVGTENGTVAFFVNGGVMIS